MDDRDNREVALAALRLNPNTPLETRAKFHVGKVALPNKSAGFLKVAKNEREPNSSEDLGNEIVWNLHARPILAKQNIRVPEVKVYNPLNRWALFEFLEGNPVNTETLEKLLPEIARLCARISEVPQIVEPNGVANWIKSRLVKLRPDAIGSPLPKSLDGILTKAIEKVAEDERLVSGYVHGDFKPDNILVLNGQRETLAIVDSEFGTNIKRPERVLPKYHDAAYFYHLMYTQFHRPDLGEKFKELFVKEMQASPAFNAETFEFEFNSSVLERSISMGSHFVWRRDPNKPVADALRIEPKPYVQLIENSLKELCSAR